MGSIGWIACQRADFDEAGTRLGSSLTLYDEVGDPEGMGIQLCRLGWLARAQANLTRASDLFEQGVALARWHENPSCLAPALLGAGAVALDQGKPSQARHLWQEALALAFGFGELETVASALEWFAHLAVQGPAAHGLRLLSQAAALRDTLGAALQPLHKKEHDAVAARLRSAPAAVSTAASEPQKLELDGQLALAGIVASVLAADDGSSSGEPPNKVVDHRAGLDSGRGASFLGGAPS
jgi:hypothetical protein